MPDKDLARDLASTGPICVLANPKSGRNARGRDAIDAAMRVLGPEAVLRRWSRERGLGAEVTAAIADGYRTIVAAGGDGTVMGVARALVGTEAHLAVLPLGTFNYFARGLGMPLDPAAAARAIRRGHVHRIAVGAVNGEVFLNNASLGLYPAALRAREGVYRRWGRSRLMAHLSLLRTLYRFQRPQLLRIQTDDGNERELRTPLLFVARSWYQLESFGLDGKDAIRADRFAVFVARDGSRAHLFKLAFRLVSGSMQAGRDIDLLSARRMVVHTTRPRPHVAFDGERQRLAAPLSFEILDDALSILLPDPADREGA